MGPKNDMLVTIITACRNSEATITNTLKSVINQSFKNIQYIVIDGASTDKTLEIIKKYAGSIDVLISEKDSGVYDAWNKGLAHATGDIIGFLNADDTYSVDTVLQAVDMLSKENGPALIYGSVVRHDPVENTYKVSKVRKFNTTIDTKRLIRGFGFWHTSVFANKQCFEVAGRYFDSNFRVAGDFEWLLRAHLSGCLFLRSYHSVTMSAGGLSDKYWRKGVIETYRAMEQNGVNISLADKTIAIFARRLGESRFLRRVINETKGICAWLINLLTFLLPSFRCRLMVMRLFGAKIADGVTLHRCKIAGMPKKLSIGFGSTINKKAFIDARGGLTIGANVTIASNVTILTAGHDIDCPAFSYVTRPVEIGDYAVIFSNVLISPGVCIGRGAVVMPGSVVSKSIEPYQIVGGNPAKFIRNRTKNLVYSASFPIVFN